MPRWRSWNSHENRIFRILTAAAREDDRVLLLTGDHGYALFDEFRQHCPDQYINCGIAEQNMVGVAAGLAKAGFRPVVYGLSAFVPVRVLEQIKLDVCYEHLPVIFIGDGAGVVYAQLGTSHQSTEDVAALRAVPNIDIASPADRFELEYCWQYLLTSERPGYLRFGKADRGDVQAEIPAAKPGCLLPVKQGGKTWAMIATGSMVKTAVTVADAIGDVSVYSVPFITPFDTAQLKDIAQGVDKLFVMEEHSVIGGLGSLVAETLAEKPRCEIVRFGTTRFSELCGTYDYLMRYHGIDAAQIEADIRQRMA